MRGAEAGLGNQGGITANRTMLIAAAIAALIPLLAPLSGYAVGVAGALAGMGAAGVLAIFGIKNEMAAGTSVGNQYAAGINLLTGSFKQLANTSAESALKGFTVSLAAIQAAMPNLNSQMAMFGKQLGGTTISVVKMVIDAFRILNPLFVQAGFYVQQVAAALQHWTSDGGLQQFTQMAVSSLPQVADALASLVKGALDLVGAFAPLGSIMLTVVTVIGQLLSLIAPLLGNLTPLGVAVGVVAGGFALWKQISPILDTVRTAIRGVGVDLSTMMGVAGLAVAVIGYLASAFVTQRMQAAAAAQALQNYTAAVEQDNGVIGQNVKLQAAKWAADKQSLGNYTTMGKSAVDVGRELGVSAKTVTDASLGQRDALNQVAKAMQAYSDDSSHSTAKVAALRAEFNDLAAAFSDNKRQIDSQIKSYNDVAAAQGLSTISTQGELAAQQHLAKSYGISVDAMLGAEAAQKQNADQAAATTRQLQFENDAATLLKNAFDLLNGTNLSVAQAQTASAAATNSLTDALAQNGLVIDGNSKAAVTNQQALQQKAAADQQAAEAIAKQTGSTEAGTQAFAASRQALIDQLTATHQLTPAIQALIDKYYAVPPVVKTKAEMDADAALATVANLKAQLASIRNQTVTLTVVTNNVGAPATMPANTTKGYKYADGGTVMGPGGPKSDQVQAWLSVGEEVTPQPQASKFRPVLKALSRDDVAGARNALGAGGSHAVAPSVTIDAPIYADGIGLLGWVRMEAGKQAQLVWDKGQMRMAQEMQGGLV
ncbi:hypothetical protein ASF88_12205 [Leifsonia sp. Leaf336]|nr:hypothetical protein ASF88_12205 [Leifsonia sp. Leaf336]